MRLIFLFLFGFTLSAFAGNENLPNCGQVSTRFIPKSFRALFMTERLTIGAYYDFDAKNPGVLLIMDGTTFAPLGWIELTNNGTSNGYSSGMAQMPRRTEDAPHHFTLQLKPIELDPHPLSKELEEEARVGADRYMTKALGIMAAISSE